MTKIFYRGSIFFLVCLFTSCNTNKDKMVIQDYLAINLDDYSHGSLNIKKVKLSQDYDFPYFVFISISMDSLTAIKLFNKLNMIKYDPIKSTQFYKDAMCFHYDNVESFFKVSPLTFQTAFIANNRYEKWWHPDSSYLNSFAGNYELLNYNKGKPVLCNSKYDGRIAGNFYKNNTYILIECFLK